MHAEIHSAHRRFSRKPQFGSDVLDRRLTTNRFACVDFCTLQMNGNLRPEAVALAAVLWSVTTLQEEKSLMTTQERAQLRIIRIERVASGNHVVELLQRDAV